MKLKISMAAIKEAAKLTSAFAASANDLAELRCLKLSIDDGMMKVTAFNRTSWIHLTVAGVESDGPGAFLIDAETFRRWVAAGSDDKPLDMEIRGDTAHLKNGWASCKIPVLDAAKYPDPTYSPSENHTVVLLKASALANALASVSFAMEKRDIKRTRTDVVYFDIDTKLNLVATDDKVVSTVALDGTINGSPISQSIPYASARLLTPLLESAVDSDATIKLNRVECIIRTERWEFGTRLIDAKQFPWRKLFDLFGTEEKPKITIPVKELNAAIRQVLAADPSEFRLSLSFDTGVLEVRIPDKSETIVDIPGNEVQMSFRCQPDQVLDLLNVVQRRSLPLTIEWGLNRATNRIALFRAGADWRYTVTALVEPSTEGAA